MTVTDSTLTLFEGSAVLRPAACVQHVLLHKRDAGCETGKTTDAVLKHSNSFGPLGRGAATKVTRRRSHPSHSLTVTHTHRDNRSVWVGNFRLCWANFPSLLVAGCQRRPTCLVQRGEREREKEAMRVSVRWGRSSRAGWRSTARWWVVVVVVQRRGPALTSLVVSAAAVNHPAPA